MKRRKQKPTTRRNAMPSQQAQPQPQLRRPDLQVVLDDGEIPRLYVVQGPDGQFWKPGEAGYTPSLPCAGTFPESQALELAKRRDGDLAVPLEQAVREHLGEVNPVVAAAIAALGAGR